MTLRKREIELIELNEYVIRLFCNKFNISYDDNYGDLAIILCRSARKYIIEQPGLQKWSFNTILWWNFKSYYSHMYRNANKTNFLNSMYYLDHVHNNDDDTDSRDILYEDIHSEYSYHEVELFDVLDRCSSSFSDRDKKILQLSYIGLNQMEISKRINCSQITVSRTLNRIKNEFKKACYA